LGLDVRSMIGPATRIWQEVSKVVIGKDDIKFMLLVALLCRGHVLIEGLAGSAKTTLARTFARVVGGEFKRIQFTPDMLPSDVTGFYIYTPDGGSRFVPGPIFGNVVLADELNRTTPRTQAGLLEAMQERQVTVEGKTHPLPKTFMVIASQVPYGAEGTYPLTEVQIDRFMFRGWSDYPGREVEEQVIEKIDYLEEPDVSVAVEEEEVADLQQAVKGIHVSDNIRDYIVTLVERARHAPDVLVGPSPRASIALYKGARAAAFLQLRDFVIPDDVKALVPAALEHRIRLKPEAEMEDVTPKTIVESVLEEVRVPKVG
jgi:MoxR-like ATPase